MSTASNTDGKYPQVDNPLFKQIEVIAAQLLEKKEMLKEPGLLQGKAGITLLYAYLHKVFPDSGYLQVTMNYLDELHHSLAHEELSHNSSMGVAGIAFVFQHLRNIGVLDASEDLDLSEVDKFISQGGIYDSEAGHWDILHGLTGLGIYFLERNKETGEKKYLENIVESLAVMRTTVGGHKIWATGTGMDGMDNYYDFGMAHGIPGVLSFLAQVHARGIKQHEIEEMLTSCVPFMLMNEYKDERIYSFPSYIHPQSPDETRHYSRLAWCYGDLCVANALIHCGKALGNEGWKNKGIEVALKTTLRTLDNSGCTDASFCHGSAGIVHQYNRLYQLTGKQEFKSATDNWLVITQQKFYKPGEGAGGYFFKSFNSDKEDYEFISNYGLLEGSCGIALVYLSYLFDIKPDWDLVFLTNV